MSSLSCSNSIQFNFAEGKHIIRSDVNLDFVDGLPRIVLQNIHHPDINKWRRNGKFWKLISERQFLIIFLFGPQVRTADEEHLALMGPIIRGEVGDQININFFNNCSRSVSVHAHGVFYYKGHEGSPYNDGTSGEAPVCISLLAWPSYLAVLSTGLMWISQYTRLSHYTLEFQI